MDISVLVLFTLSIVVGYTTWVIARTSLESRVIRPLRAELVAAKKEVEDLAKKLDETEQESLHSKKSITSKLTSSDRARKNAEYERDRLADELAKSEAHENSLKLQLQAMTKVIELEKAQAVAQPIALSPDSEFDRKSTGTENNVAPTVLKLASNTSGAIEETAKPQPTRQSDDVIMKESIGQCIDACVDYIEELSNKQIAQKIEDHNVAGFIDRCLKKSRLSTTHRASLAAVEYVADFLIGYEGKEVLCEKKKSDIDRILFEYHRGLKTHGVENVEAIRSYLKGAKSQVVTADHQSLEIERQQIIHDRLLNGVSSGWHEGKGQFYDELFGLLELKESTRADVMPSLIAILSTGMWPALFVSSFLTNIVKHRVEFRIMKANSMIAERRNEKIDRQIRRENTEAERDYAASAQQDVVARIEDAMLDIARESQQSSRDVAEAIHNSTTDQIAAQNRHFNGLKADIARRPQPEPEEYDVVSNSGHYLGKIRKRS